ncbi:hypothetical protein FRB96_004775 [Tulasnella sp. 330]|nr:hypothetical protein FRB96_004775 [Tulasnella sp. 330]
MPGRFTLLSVLVLALAAAWRYSPGAQPGTSSVEAYFSTLFSPVTTIFDIMIPPPDGKLLMQPSNPEEEPATSRLFESPEASAKPEPVPEAPKLIPEVPAGAKNVPNIGDEQAQLETLGPIVVNSDGSLGRISGWAEMNPQERAYTHKQVTKRNRLKAVKGGVPYGQG